MTKHLTIILTIIIASFTTLCHADVPTGSWRGELDLGRMKLPLVVNLSKDGGGNVSCTLDSPSQGVKGLATTVELCTADSISLTCSAIGASYQGRVEGDAIKGVFSQRGHSFPLDLAPEAAMEERRPQTPRGPFPYTVVDTTFTTPDGAVMSATLSMPAATGKKKVPAVVMVTGSGAQNRDEELFDHKPFAVIADYLARHGIASLRYDDRGFGKSTGDLASATTFTFKDDAASGIRFLKSLDGIGKVGVLGHSEGGTIAFMLGASRLPDFIVSLAGAAVPAKEILLDQNGHALEMLGLSGDDKENHLRLISLMFDAAAEQAREGVSRPIDIDSLVAQSGITANPQIVASMKMNDRARTPWFNTFVALNPMEFLKKTKCPVLAINGDKDTQVNGPANLGVIEKTIPKAEIHLMPGLNHLMQHADTGEMSEYSQISETISPEVLEIIADFINKKAR